MRRSLEMLEAGFGRLARFLAVLVAASIGLITVLIPLNLLLVKTHLGSLWWLYEAVEYALYAGVFLGAPWVLQQGAHVRVDVVLSALPRLQAIRLERAVDLASALLCLVLCYYGVRATIVEFQAGTLPDKDLRIANWCMTAVFAFSFLALAMEFGFRFRRAGDIVAGEKAARGF